MIISRKFALYFCVVGAIMLGFNRRDSLAAMVGGASFLALGVLTLNKAAKDKEEAGGADEATPPSPDSEEE